MNRIRKILFFSLFIVTANILLAQNGVDKAEVYAAMSSGKRAVLDAQLKKLKTKKGNDKEAFEGALLMRKASLPAAPAQKISMFKQGHKLLEAAIAADKKNAEYRFLRLMIQENAPTRLGYNKNLAEDQKVIKTAFPSLSGASRKAVLNYSRHSKLLPASAFH